MLVTRRTLLGGGLAALGAGVVGGCSTAPKGTGSANPSGAGSSGGAVTKSTLWYWGGGLSTAVVKAAETHFAAQATLQASVIGGDFKQKLQTAITGGKFLPNVTGVKGEDMPYFRSVGAKFVDLNTFGAASVAGKQLAWKWKEGQSPDGVQIGYPIDIGPTALFYRMDIFEKAGLPSDPTKVGDAVKTWDAFFALGQELHAKVPNSYPVSSLGSVWAMVTGQTKERFLSQDNKFTGDSDELHQAWLTACKPQALGINANAAGASFNPALVEGKIAGEFGAAWHALDLSDAAPKTKGKWRVANNPVAPTNYGGSFLAIPANTPDPQLSYQIIEWILSPENQAKGFTDASIFPADPAAWTSEALTQGDPFFGGQKTIDIFGPAAQIVPAQYTAPADAAVSAPYGVELSKVETAGKDPEKAWTDAVAAAKQVAARQGVK